MWKPARSKKPKRLGDLLPKFFDKWGIREKLTQQQAVILWNKAVGEPIAKNCTAHSIENGILLVLVSNSVWMNELTFLKSKIIKKLNDLIGKKVVKDIRFRLK